MPLMSTFNPPTREEHSRIMATVRRVRIMDTNLTARMHGYIAASNADLPVVDPHGEPWTLMSAQDLEERKGWCMLPEMHDALQRELERRHSLTNYYRPIQEG